MSWNWTDQDLPDLTSASLHGDSNGTNWTNFPSNYRPPSPDLFNINFFGESSHPNSSESSSSSQECSPKVDLSDFDLNLIDLVTVPVQNLAVSEPLPIFKAKSTAAAAKEIKKVDNGFGILPPLTPSLTPPFDSIWSNKNGSKSVDVVTSNGWKSDLHLLPSTSASSTSNGTKMTLAMPPTAVAATAPVSQNGNLKEKQDEKLKIQKQTLQQQQGQLLPAIFMYPRYPEQVVGCETVFYVQATETRKILPNVNQLYVTIQHPNRFMESKPLQLDNSRRSTNGPRYFFSFIPTLPGRHIITLMLQAPVENGRPRGAVKLVQVAGGSQSIFVSRNYSRVRQDSSNLLRLGFSSPKSKNGNGFLIKPWGIAIDRQTNNIYLTDRETHQITVVSPRGMIVNRFGKSGHSSGQLWRPTGIVVDSANDRVIVSDKDNHRICVYSTLGLFLFSFGSAGHKDGFLNYPWGIDVTRDGSIIAVADSRNHRIQMFDKNGGFLRKYSVFEERPFDYKEELYYPRGVAFDHTGENLYVTDFNLNAMLKLDRGLTKKEELLSSSGNNLLNRPQGLAVDPAGNILLCDSKSQVIRVVKPDGSYICSLDQSGGEPFNSPTDLAVFDDGKIAVIDSDGRLRVF